MWLCAIANDGRQDRLLPKPDPKPLYLTFTECIEECIESMQNVAVKRIQNDIAEHAQAITRWLLAQAFQKHQRTKQRFPEFARLVFRYLPKWKKSSFFDGKEYDLKWKSLQKYIPPYKRESPLDYIERVVYLKFDLLKDLIIVHTVERKHNKWVMDAVIKYLKSTDAGFKKSHVISCTRLFRGKILGMREFRTGHSDNIKNGNIKNSNNGKNGKNNTKNNTNNDEQSDDSFVPAVDYLY